MPIHPNDTDKTKMPKTGPDIFKDNADANTGASNLEKGTEAVNYGIENGAQLHPRRDVTQDQEYEADGLPRTSKYTYDNTTREPKKKSNRRD